MLARPIRHAVARNQVFLGDIATPKRKGKFLDGDRLLRTPMNPPKANPHIPTVHSTIAPGVAAQRSAS